MADYCIIDPVLCLKFCSLVLNILKICSIIKKYTVRSHEVLMFDNVLTLNRYFLIQY